MADSAAIPRGGLVVAAHDSGARPFSSFELASAVPVASNSFTIASFPLSAAHGRISVNTARY
jgi:hypothetical protein